MVQRPFPQMKRFGMAGGAALFILALCLPLPDGMTPQGRIVGAAGLLMAVWWLTECIPIPATSLLPLVLFPSLGVMPMKTVCACFADPNIMLPILAATLSASCAFMLPVATPPNAIVFSSGRLAVRQMAVPVFGISLGQVPLWAQ